MALVYDSTPLDGAGWRQGAPGTTDHEVLTRVTGFVSTTYYDMVAELYADPGLPKYDDQLPGALSFMRLRGWEIDEVICGSPIPEIHLRLIYTQQVRRVTYTQTADKDGPVIFRQRSLAQDEELQFNIAGNEVWTLYENKEQRETFIRQRSLMVLECERYEDANPEARAVPLLDKVNSLAWNGRAARTVLFSDFSADTRDGGLTYFCLYSFLYRADTHDPIQAFTNPDGLVPRGAGSLPAPPLPENNAAYIRPKYIEEADFAPLNIVIP